MVADLKTGTCQSVSTAAMRRTFSQSDIVVQEWGGAIPHQGQNGSSYDALSIGQKVLNEVEENGIERPKGHVVSFHYNPQVEHHHFGRSHPMKPWRLVLTKQLILAYGLQYAMDLYHTREATKQELADFHNQEYLDFLEKVTPDNMESLKLDQARFNFGDDCPVFDDLYNYCTLYSGATMDATRKLISKQSDIAINWSGGLHHAKKAEASGFCYINDIVLAIVELLRYNPRVLYIDIDVHHGDGVEQAFFSTDRVMTLSFHKYDPADFFPGTGGLYENGPEHPKNPGAHFSLNVPLQDGIDDEQYKWLFEQITGPTIDSYDPTAIVLQCGADSLGGDRLGKFNLNIKAHGHCIDFVRRKGRPLLILGGGGYTARNVARLWCHETSLCVGATLKDKLPSFLPYRRAFDGEENGSGKLYPRLDDIDGKRHANAHTKQYLQGLVEHAHEQLRYLKGCPSVQMHRIPPGIQPLMEDVDKALEEEAVEKEKIEASTARKRKERNTGGRGEHR